jgi:hypothetical protein
MKDDDLSQRILKNLIWVTFLMSQYEKLKDLPDNNYYLVDHNLIN